MKRLTKFIMTAVVAAAAIALSGCKEDTPNTGGNTISLSQSSATFTGADNKPVIITVICSDPAWNYSTEQDWITISDRTNNSVKVSVADNDEGKTRTGQVVFSADGYDDAILTIQQTAKDSVEAMYRIFDMFDVRGVISPGGLYCAGYVIGVDEENDSYTYTPVVVDIMADDVRNYDPYPQAVHDLDYSCAITDDGRFFVETNKEMLIINPDLTEETVQSPNNWSNYPHIMNVSEGTGNIWVGYVAAEGAYHTLKYTDGIAQVLPNPELDARDMTPSDLDGMTGRGCSLDGSILYGTYYNYELVDAMHVGYWSEADGNKFHWAGEDCRKITPVQMIDSFDGSLYDYNLVNGFQNPAGSDHAMSPDGKWIAGNYMEEAQTDDNMEIVFTANKLAFFNVEEQKTYIYDITGEYGWHVTNDGLGFTITTDGTAGNVYDVRTGELISTAVEWVAQQTGMMVNSGAVDYVASNGVIFGHKMVFNAQMGGLDNVNWYVVPEQN